MTRRYPRFGRVITRLLFHQDEMIVVPKNDEVKRRVVEVGIDIEDAGQKNVLPSEIIKTVLRKSEKIFIMDFCLCRRSNKCQDYPVGKGCIFVGKGTNSIPPEYGRFVTPEEACEHIDECSALGLVHIIGRNKIDSVWLNIPGRHNLLTICNCCPCCCLWNMARDIDPVISNSFHRVEGASINLDDEKCIGCGICYESCFVRAISIKDGKCIIDQDACRVCGRCSESCPKDAITIGFDAGVIDREADRMLALFNQ